MTNVQLLLNDLCSKLGYCLSPAEQEKIVADPPPTVDAFADAVIRAEGLDSILIDTQQRRQIRDLVAAAFGEPPWPRRPGSMHRR